MVDGHMANPRNMVKRQISNILNFINSGVTIFLISLLNGYLYSKLSGTYTKGQSIDISIGYTTAIVGVVFSIMMPGKLQLFKSLSLISACFVLIIAETLGRSALSLTCILISLFHLMFIFLKRYMDYTHIPHSLIVGFKITLAIMVFFQQFLTFPQSSISPSGFNFTDYFIHVRSLVGTYEFEKLMITLIGSIIMAGFIKVYVRVPWNTLLLVSGIFFMLLVGSFDNILTLDKLISVKSSYINITLMIEDNIFNLVDFALLADQRLWVYSFGFALIIWYESMMTINYVRGYEFRHTHSKLECLGLVAANTLCGLFGLLPLTNSFATNIQLKSLRSLNRFYFVGGLLMLLIAPLSVWSITRYVPVFILPIFYTSMMFAEIRIADFELLYRFNKNKLVYVFLLPVMCLYIDLIYAFVFTMIIYHTFYGLNRSNTYYHFDDTQMFFNRVIKFARDNKEIQEEERTSLNQDNELSRLEDEKARISNDSVVYSLMGKYTYSFNEFHTNVLSYKDENIVIVNFEFILKQDIDFLANYNKLLREIQKMGKELYITGINQEDLNALIKLPKRSFLIRFHMKNAIFFID